MPKRTTAAGGPLCSRRMVRVVQKTRVRRGDKFASRCYILAVWGVMQSSFNIFPSAIFYIYIYILYGEGAAAATNDLGHDLRTTFLIFPVPPPPGEKEKNE